MNIKISTPNNTDDLSDILIDNSRIELNKATIEMEDGSTWKKYGAKTWEITTFRLDNKYHMKIKEKEIDFVVKSSCETIPIIPKSIVVKVKK